MTHSIQVSSNILSQFNWTSGKFHKYAKVSLRIVQNAMLTVRDTIVLQQPERSSQEVNNAMDAKK